MLQNSGPRDRRQRRHSLAILHMKGYFSDSQLLSVQPHVLTVSLPSDCE
jgi:hypothetical protein